ncbi:3'-5' exoribonuclease YhaM family protein [Hathewaya histolytica]|uniref:3'-5' exoribonuclease YhaM family protein n=1 Tax=Hathewaya histolytica TaxID=1498 RepID=UPI003B67E895
MNSKTIGQFQRGDKIQGIFLVKDITCRLTNGTNNKFLDIELMDRTGEINAKLWECRDGKEDTIKANMLVKVTGNVVDWRGKLQFKVDTITPVNEKDTFNAEDFVPVAPNNPKDMFDELLGYKERIKNKDVKKILEYILDEAGDAIMYYPAAKSNHHSIRSGLLYHITTMLKVGEKLCEIYDFINKDLLYAGIIIHDIAKIEEMESNTLGIVDKYSVEGQLLGHIVIGVRKIEVAAEKVGADKEVAMLLQHMVLSHHYEAEYGSPKKPMIPEAELLHHIDVMDARMYDMRKAVSETEEGSFSDRIWSLDNLSVYRSNLKREE